MIIKMTKFAIGQDSHRIDYEKGKGKVVIGGVEFEENFSIVANSDGDVVLHALTNAISGITCKNILGKMTDEMCKNEGITDGKEYVKEALKYLKGKITHVSITIECKLPKITPKVEEMRKSIGNLLEISENSVGITATTGEGLTEFGKGNGIQAFVCITVEEDK